MDIIELIGRVHQNNGPDGAAQVQIPAPDVRRAFDLGLSQDALFSSKDKTRTIFNVAAGKVLPKGKARVIFTKIGDIWSRRVESLDVDAILEQEERAADEAIAEVENNPAFNNNPTVVTIKNALKERKERVGQQRWSNGVRKEDAVKGIFTCVFTGDSTAVEAAHLNIPGQPYSKFGISIRKDLAHRWDWTDRTMIRIEDGSLVLNMPGTPYDRLVAKMSQEKIVAVIAELQTMQGRI